MTTKPNKESKMKKLTIDPKYTKTYKTVANLEKALDKKNWPDTLTYLEVEVDGRFTAVFTNVTAGHGDNHMYLATIASAGFKVVG
jgi:hypothetical protein